MPSRVTLTVNTFQLPNGLPVALGTITMRLNQIGSVNVTQLGVQFTAIKLDANGMITGSPTFWHNSDISPSGTYYIQTVYSSTGQVVAGPNVVTV
jgi:hypothetical protein